MDQDLFFQFLDFELADRHVAPPEQKRPPFSGGLLIALIEADQATLPPADLLPGAILTEGELVRANNAPIVK
jgi:hypothetical protein